MDTIARLNGSLAGRYTIGRELGAGGMAVVYLAHDVKHDRQVAFKVLRADIAQSVGAERFLREIAIAAQLQHPNILTLIDSGEVHPERSEGPPLLYYVMPYVEGESLRDRLARDGALPVSEAARLLRDVVDALAYAHRHGVVHRDMKPDNVMIASRHALVVDFGVAKAMSEASGGRNLTSVGVSLGTPAYMAPEQAAADPVVDARADIYAVGVLAYEMLAGAPPFTGSTQAVLAAQITAVPPPIASVRPDVPPALANAVMKCLEKDPASRFQSADQLLEALEAFATPGAGVAGLAAKPTNRARTAAMAAALLLVVIALTWIVTARGRRERWVHETAIPDIQRLSTELAMDSAFALATRAAAILPDDPVLKSLWPRFSAKVVIQTDPPGASIYRAPFADTSRWEPLGKTPTDSVLLPSVMYERLRIEKAGYRPMRALFSSIWSQNEPYVLDSASSPHPEMVHVSRGMFSAALPGLDQLERVKLGDFLIDRYEVTNREYKAFVSAGGYTKQEYWAEPFVNAGRAIPWEEAMTSFKDKTGREGPSSWKAGDVPGGQEDLPVGGVSWYEAAAYAAFAGKSLPTVYHWNRAAETAASSFIVPGSNLEARGPAKGSTFLGMSPFGAFDMAGNVREWCLNEDAKGERYILGGGWSDPTYSFNDAYAQSPFDRSPINGIRLVKLLRDEPNLALASRPLEQAYRDYSKEQPVSGELYETFRRMYDYDRSPLNAKVESRDTTPADWVTEKVSFDAAYGRERVLAYLFLPKRHQGPFQTVVYFPGDGGVHVRSSAGPATGSQVDFFIKSGRAVIWPIYKSTHERSDSMESTVPNLSIFYRDHVVMWAKDMRRSMDYLATRADIDTARFAYFGVSWGGRLGGLMPAIEPRFKTVVLFVAGLRFQRPRPEADPFNFLPRVTVPVLMLDAKYDNYFPIETSQKPFFRLLGTPADRKRYVVYEGGHILPRTQLITESLAWLDKYLGPVR
jgi:formylglycine-generating enzyme required for sulfatase activity/dienelactone hydrolase